MAGEAEPRGTEQEARSGEGRGGQAGGGMVMGLNLLEHLVTGAGQGCWETKGWPWVKDRLKTKRWVLGQGLRASSGGQRALRRGD